ncbi:hypothetical protein J2Z42_002331 [Clostridium algifaecis]|uniref:DUF4317 family protein n=1 Tax=Clostridium algifaecis TaxID=1472040 RepID=A0ABS4KUA5_9CLOT|nr:DUF4317 domain-containing protein [Clostridium algifaecis]MBP2033627.1 hypothetical protein [Clostridium algifaecis]
MNKKDLSSIRKEFKLESYALPIKEVYSVYLKKDNGQIITKELTPFGMMDIETRELYLNNFKKVLTGTIDSKIFELDFKEQNQNIENGISEESTQSILYRALSEKSDIPEFADKIVDRISKNFNYDTDIVINFIKAEYYSPNKKSKDNEDESLEDYVHAMEFILCSINKVDIPKKVLKFDYSQMKFTANSALDVTINLNSPMDGFLFPSFSYDYVDVNKVIYYSHKSKELNQSFVEGVLDCRLKPTAIEEKHSFNTIVQTAVENKIKPQVMQQIYENINEKLESAEDDEEPKINMKEVSNILEESGVEDKELIKNAFEEVCGGDYEFKVKNIVPDFESRSVKIENDNINITITPGNLSAVKQIRDKQGRKCLLIVLNEDVTIDGLNVETETENEN